MKSLYLIAVFILAQSVGMAQIKSPPNWAFDPGAFQYSANITSQVMYNDTPATGTNNIVGAFSGTELRGYARPILYSGKYIFFLTAFTNSPSDVITFKFYNASIDSVIPVQEQLTIAPNGIYGSVAAPFQMHAYFSFDRPPVVRGIPDQSVERGTAFVQFDLDNYLTENDGNAVTWSFRGNSQISVSKDANNVVTLSPANANWTGSETIIFRATDVTANAFFGEDTAVFTVTHTDHAPDLNGVPSQTIGKNAAFAKTDLRGFTTELDGDSLAWSYAYITTGSSDPAPSWSVNAGAFTSSMTLTAAVNFPGGTVNGSGNTLAAFAGTQVRGTATGILFAGKQLFFLTVYGNTAGDTITFRYYDAGAQKVTGAVEKTVFATNASLGSPVAPYTVTAGNVVPSITPQGMVSFARPDASWRGSERIRFTARDAGTVNGLQDTLSAVYSVLNENAPLIAGIPDQTIVAPQTFAPISLNTYIAELDGDNISVSILNNTHIQAVIDAGRVAAISVTPEDWSGSENVIFRVTDLTTNGLSAQDTVKFTRRAADNPPIFGNVPVQATGVAGTFPPLNIRSYITETDGDSVEILYGVKRIPGSTATPSWEVNSSQFVNTMNITAEVTSAGIKASGTGHLLAAYAGGVIRGVASPIKFGSKWLYFLAVYSNTSGEKVTFKFYDAGMQRIYPVQGSITFSSNAIVGSPSSPVQLQAGNLLFSSLPGNAISAVIVDSTWSGTETLQVIARDALTASHNADTVDVVYRVGAFPQMQLTVLLEGLYRAAADTMVADTVSVFLHAAGSTHEQIDFARAKTNNHGECSLPFAFANQNESYYVVVKHRNSIETWSRIPVQFTNNALTYNFTADSSAAYGSNLKKVGSKWCVFAGDVNQDGIVDYGDLVRIDNANFLFLAGYRAEDVNGDNFTDFSDMVLADNNSFNFVSAITPKVGLKTR